jgi:hypothetical protein
MLQKLAASYASGRLEIEHNGERIRYVSKKDMKMVADEIANELRSRGALISPETGEQPEKPNRVLYLYQSGNP